MSADVDAAWEALKKTVDEGLMYDNLDPDDAIDSHRPLIEAAIRAEGLDVERLREAVRRTVDVTTQRRLLPYLPVIAAEYARLAEAEHGTR